MNDEPQRVKIAFLTRMDPQDKRAWSGSLFHTAQALQKYCGEVYCIISAVSREKPRRKAFYRWLGLLVKKYSTHNPFFSVGRKFFVSNYRISTAKKFVKAANKWLATHAFDVIVAPASTTEVAFLNTDIPIVLVEDATFASLHNYYPQYSGLSKRTVRKMHSLSDVAIKRASLLIYASSWAAQSAILDYHADPQKVRVAPMGANVEKPPPIELIQKKKKSDCCRLMFVGFDWQRKGGDIAFQTLLKLEALGISAELIVCGCVPPKQFSHERMKIIPYLDKNDPTQYKELERIYMSSDFLFLPTRNECFGITFCEANAFGLPVITTSTGGVPEVVRNGENGFVLPLGARGAEFADVIAKIYQDDQLYAKLVLSSRAAYENRLNWDSWGIAVTKFITEMLERENSSRDISQFTGPQQTDLPEIVY